MSDGFVWAHNRVPIAAAAFPERVEAAVAKTAFNILADAQSRAPVLTGFLRNSGMAESAGALTWKVAFTADYAIYVEFGTRYMTAQPYLIPAWVSGRYRLMQALARMAVL